MNKMGRRIRNVAFGLTALAATAAVTIGKLGGFSDTKSKYETIPAQWNPRDTATLEDGRFYDKDDWAHDQAKAAFDHGDSLGNENAILVINLPDTRRTNLAERMGRNMIDHKKEEMYEKFSKIPNTTFFAYGSNDENEDIDEVYGLVKALRESKAKNVMIVFSAHGNETGLLSANSKIEIDAKGDTIKAESKILSYDEIGLALYNNFSERPNDKKISLMLFPCSTGSFNADGMGESYFENIKDFSVYCAAGAGETSSPGDALRGLEKIADASIKRGDLLSMDEMSVLLAEGVTNQPGKYYSPQYAHYECGKMDVKYGFYGDQDKIKMTKPQIKDFEKSVQQNLSKEEAQALLSTIDYQIDTSSIAGYMTDKLKDSPERERIETEIDNRVQRLVSQDPRVDELCEDTQKEALEQRKTEAMIDVATAPHNAALFNDLPYVAKLFNENQPMTKTALSYEERPGLFAVMMTNFAPENLKQAAFTLKMGGQKQ